MNRAVYFLAPLVLIPAFVTVFSASSIAQTSAPATTPDRGERENVLFEGGRPYCGVYCVYASSRMLGRSLQLKDLVQPKYIGSSEGSSTESLQRAAEDLGLHTAVVTNATFSLVANAETPVILHVLSDSATGRYDHWVTLLKGSRTVARIFDPPTNFVTIPTGELIERWDGNALLLSTEPIPVGKLVLKGALSIAAVVVALLLTAFAAGWYLRRRVVAISVAREVAVLACAIMLLGIGANIFANTGLFARSNAGRRIVEASAGHLCKHVDLSAVKFASEKGPAVLVDARFRGDFDAGHVPNAINVPPNASLYEVRRSLHDVLPSSRIIVYCTSPSCSYSGVVAGKLIETGYDNIQLFPGGWQAWQRAQSE